MIVSALRAGDEALHYSDWSHRWLAPDPADDATWTLTEQAHMDDHRATAGTQHVPIGWAGPKTLSDLD